jgi:pimeloyl-ACP methyl ester carboxylesterase
MEKIKLLTLIFVVFGGLFFLFGLEVVPEHLQVQEILDSVTQNDIIIIFNSGGWGDTPLEEAEDFSPIVKEIQGTLSNWGYSSIVIPYRRATGKISGAKDFLNFFDFSSEALAEDLESIIRKLPDKKIIMAGLSNGGAFVRKTIERVSDDVKDSIFVISVGSPFWHKSSQPENTLQLTNKGKDSLSVGEVKGLLLALIKTPFRWILSKINGQNLPFAQAFQAPGHEYGWSSPEVGPQIVTFLRNKIR